MTTSLHLLWPGLLLGIAGGLHCLGMCGPLVVAATRVRKAQPCAHRNQLLHHLGRVTSYSLMGLTAGSMGRIVSLAGWQQPLSIGMGFLVIGAVMAPRLKSLSGFVGYQIAHLTGALSRQLTSQSPWSHLGLGLCHGLLPCGLVYVAVASAAATGHPISGGLFMVAFGLGTFPALLGVGMFQQWSFQLGSRAWINGSVLKGLALFTGGILILRGLGLGIPLLSPDLGAPEMPHCCATPLAESPTHIEQIRTIHSPH